jgi:hypothetical protein
VDIIEVKPCSRLCQQPLAEDQPQESGISENDTSVGRVSEPPPSYIPELRVDVEKYRGETSGETAATSSGMVELNDTTASQVHVMKSARATIRVRNGNEQGDIVRWRSIRKENNEQDEREMSDERYDKILMFHNFVGHGGIDRTMNRLRKKGNKWLRMRQDVRQFIRE